MAKDYKINDDIYIYLVKYFDSDITNLSDKVVSELKKSKYNDKPIKPIDKKIIQTFMKILQLKKQKPKVYAKINWKYPEYTEEEKLEKLKEFFPEDYKEEIETILKESDEDKLLKQKIKYTYEEQIQILRDFYTKTEDVPEKNEKEIIGIIDRRRDAKDPKGSPMPSKPWLTLCDKLEEKYNVNPLYYYTIPKDIREAYQEKIGEVEVKEVESVSTSVIPQRKAFVEWMNDVYYGDQLKEYQKFKEFHKNGEMRFDDKLKLAKIKSYQHFVKEYLNNLTPFRGLLIYHGLGTGKTATSVVTAEGISDELSIYTMLPASLENNYINEVKDFGDKSFRVNTNNWVFYPIDEIKESLSLRKKLQDKYGVDESDINKVANRTKSKLKKIIDKDDQDKLSEMIKKVNSIKGVFLQSENINTETKDIYTITGEALLNDKEIYNGNVIKLDQAQIYYIENQIDIFIKLKYNFIHYNGFPKVEDIDFKSLENPEKAFNILTNDKDKEANTDNQKLVEKLSLLYQNNLQKHGVLSPFRNNVIIIDEVHNFVNEIINGSVPANIFYNWIVNSEDTKLVFLSGTPVINKPAEIAILYNMLRGVLHVYEYSVISDKDEYDVQKLLRDIFYTEKSPIEQLHVSKKRGKLIISFTKTKTNFESIMEDGIIRTIKYNDHSLETFFDIIHEGLEKVFDKESILPTKQQLRELKSLNDLKLGKAVEFDKEIKLIFNRKQKLFDIYDNEQIIDLSNNETFMNYFFDEGFNIPQKKQVLLRRMLMGLTSYYPIDRSSIENMAQVVEPVILPLYEEYNIVKNINIIPCFMSSIQWVNYSDEYTKDKLKKIQQLRRNKIYDNKNSDFNIRTRQNCNIVYEDDTFRQLKDETKKQEMYQLMKENGNFDSKGTLKLFSPKFYEILNNINKFVKDDKPTGKVLYYSDFRQDAGSEAFENVLLQHGYEKFDSEKQDIDTIIEKKDKKKRYTFITGLEKQEQRKINQDAFNHVDNIRGDYIQVILISSSGAEGISLHCVRQVHIMEPFWNYIRVDQVLGRAIRMGSHIGDDPDNPWLPEKDRNVEQYLYLTMLPNGNTIEEVFQSLKDLEWSEVEDIPNDDDIKLKLLNEHKSIYRTIQKIISMKKETNNRTVDQVLFDIMEKKYNISSKITNIIKEASIDCIQNSRDDIQLNEKCLRFSRDVYDEEAHFPGISAATLNEIDEKQFNAKFLFFIQPDIYVTKAIVNEKELYVYYKLKTLGEDIDIRYIRENGIRICDYDPYRNVFILYEKDNHKLNDLLQPKFSIFQSIYNVPDTIYELKIKKNIFPDIKDIEKKENLYGYIIKYNISEKLFYAPEQISQSILKLYDLIEYTDNNYSMNDIKSLFYRKGKLYLSEN